MAVRVDKIAFFVLMWVDKLIWFSSIEPYRAFRNWTPLILLNRFVPLAVGCESGIIWSNLERLHQTERFMVMGMLMSEQMFAVTQLGQICTGNIHPSKVALPMMPRHQKYLEVLLSSFFRQCICKRVRLSCVLDKLSLRWALILSASASISASLGRRFVKENKSLVIE